MYAKCAGKRVKDAYTYVRLTKHANQTPVEGDERDVVCYMHSGGTSGQPKIVKISNYAFNQTAITIVDMYNPVNDGTNFYLTTLPVFHAYGLCNSVHTGFVAGFNLALVPQYDVKVVKRYFNKYNITAWAAVPAMLVKLLKQNALDHKRMGKLDVIWCGGDVLPETLAERVDGILEIGRAHV